jgi:hypothetical protein
VAGVPAGGVVREQVGGQGLHGFEEFRQGFGFHDEARDIAGRDPDAGVGVPIGPDVVVGAHGRNLRPPSEVSSEGPGLVSDQPVWGRIRERSRGARLAYVMAYATSVR